MCSGVFKPGNCRGVVGWFLHVESITTNTDLSSHVPSRIYWETPLGLKLLSIGSRVCRLVDHNAPNTAFGKIDCRTVKRILQFCDWPGTPLFLDLQRSSFWPFSDSITEKVHPSICHFGLVKSSKETRVIFSFFSTLKNWKSKFASKCL